MTAKKKQGWAAKQRGSRHKRGYGTAWDHKRDEVRAREPLCRLCRGEGFAVVWTDLDHIVPKSQGGSDDDSNLQPLCKKHHRAKTARESGQGIHPSAR